jgi:sec-independent protein translocase protein TatA
MVTGLLTPTHVAIVLIVALLVLGPKRVPQTAQALGRGLREFKDAVTGGDGDNRPQPQLSAPQITNGKCEAQRPMSSFPAAGVSQIPASNDCCSCCKGGPSK